MLIADSGFSGLIVQYLGREIRVSGERIIADAGCTMGQVVAAAQKACLTGLEWAVGLPGTVGGAVYGNAGCFGGETKDVVEEVAVYNIHEGQTDQLSNANLGFAYRHSKLKEISSVVLSATFKLKKGDAQEIARAVERIRQKSVERVAEQPLGARTAGSTFKGVEATDAVKQKLETAGVDWKKGVNRAGFISAGFLIEQAGLKGLVYGGAMFSDKHANFIINTGNTTAADIKTLIDTAKEQVKNAFGVQLEEEIRYIGF